MTTLPPRRRHCRLLLGLGSNRGLGFMAANSGKKGIVASMDVDMVRSMIRDKMAALGMTQAAYAAMCGYSAAYLSDVLAGRKDPGKAILSAEGLVAVKYYEYET